MHVSGGTRLGVLLQVARGTPVRRALSAAGYSVATAQAEVVRARDGRWRVDYWMITKFHGPGATAPADSASALGEGPPNVHKLPGKKKRGTAVQRC